MTDSIPSKKGSAIHILHVDDDLSILEISKQILMDLNSGFDIDTACCVAEACKKMETRNYDVIISDYEMPQDGLHFLKKLREEKNNIPFILFTGKGREEVVIQALNLGADHYVNKQGSPETVYSELAHLVSSSVEKYRAKLKNENDSFALSNVHDAIVSSDSNFIITAWNKAAEILFGFSSDEMLNKNIDDVFKKIQVNPNHDELMSKLRKTGYFQGEVIYQNKNGQQRNGQLNINSIISENGKFLGNVAVCSDITQRKKAEAVLKESESRYRLLADNTLDVIWTLDLQGHFTYVSPSVLQLRGYTAEEVMKQSMVEALTPESAQLVIKNMQYFRESGNISLNYFEVEQPCKDGSTVWTEVNVTILRDKDGHPLSILGVSRNITERKKAEEFLKSSEATLRAYLESSPVAIFVANPEGKYEYVNEAASRLLGYSKEELVNMTVHQVVPKDEPYSNFRLNKLKEKGYFAEEMRLRKKDDKVIYVSLHSAKLPDGKLVAFCEDISERKKAQKFLFESEANYRSLINGMDESVWVIDFNEKFVEVNDAAVKFLGYSREELLSLGIMGIDKFLSQERAVAILNNVVSVGPQVFETVHTAKNGTQIPVEISSSLITYHGNKAILSIARNITDRKKAENLFKEDSHKIEVMNEKLRVVGSLTRHDVGNKLMAAKANLFLLKKRIGDNPEWAPYLNGIDAALVSSDALFEFSRLYEQIGAEKPAIVNVGDCFDVAVTLLPSLSEIKIVNDSHGLRVVADSMLRQFFYNLLDNSLKHGKKISQIKIHYAKAKDRVKIFYEDNGIGVPIVNKSKIFDFGFSTGGGSGFGLPLIKKMIEVYGWTISEEGESGKGAKFVISIPFSSVSGFEKEKSA